MTLTVSSTIPIAAGLGSGAAISVAVSRALSAFLGSPLADESVSRIAFETDRFYHGTPSGIDNTVISYARMVFFTRGKPIEMLTNAEAFTLVIADSGEKSLTGKVVHGLRTRVEIDPQRYHPILEKIGRSACQPAKPSSREIRSGWASCSATTTSCSSNWVSVRPTSTCWSGSRRKPGHWAPSYPAPEAAGT